MKTGRNGRKGTPSVNHRRKKSMRRSADERQKSLKIGAREDHVVISGVLDANADLREAAHVLRVVSGRYRDVTIDGSGAVVQGDEGLLAWIALAKKCLVGSRVHYAPASELSFLLMHSRPYRDALPNSDFADPYVSE